MDQRSVKMSENWTEKMWKCPLTTCFADFDELFRILKFRIFLRHFDKIEILNVLTTFLTFSHLGQFSDIFDVKSQKSRRLKKIPCIFAYNLEPEPVAIKFNSRTDWYVNWRSVDPWSGILAWDSFYDTMDPLSLAGLSNRSWWKLSPARPVIPEKS